MPTTLVSGIPDQIPSGHLRQRPLSQFPVSGGRCKGAPGVYIEAVLILLALQVS